MTIKKILSFLILLVIVLLINTKFIAADSVSGNLLEGTEGTFNVDGKDYTITLDFVGTASAKFTHNSELSSTIKVGEFYVFSDGLRFDFTKIDEPNQGSGYRAWFDLSVTVVCGDGTCSSSETCQADKCCNGAVKDFSTDINNCGSCSNVCTSNKACTAGACTDISAGLASSCGNGLCDASETCSSCNSDCKCGASKRCENNACVTFCGNSICDANENNDNCKIDCIKEPICGDYVCEGNEDKKCCTDCGCERRYSCSNNRCIPKEECLTDSDCNDYNTCTVDSCSGSPKTCSNRLNETCVKNAVAIKNQTTMINNSNASVVKETSTNVTTTTEKLKTEKKQPFFARFLKWLKALFGK